MSKVQLKLTLLLTRWTNAKDEGKINFEDEVRIGNKVSAGSKVVSVAVPSLERATRNIKVIIVDF